MVSECRILQVRVSDWYIVALANCELRREAKTSSYMWVRSSGGRRKNGLNVCGTMALVLCLNGSLVSTMLRVVLVKAPEPSSEDGRGLSLRQKRK